MGISERQVQIQWRAEGVVQTVGTSRVIVTVPNSAQRFRLRCVFFKEVNFERARCAMSGTVSAPVCATCKVNSLLHF